MKLLFFVGLVLFAKCLWAQQYPIIKYGTEDGLGHSVVYRVYQDKKGFIWFSTDNGLTRYDGRQFRNFVAKDGLRSNFIFGVAENDSAMVVSTFGGGLQLTDGLRIDTVHRLAPTIKFPVNIAQQDSVLWVVDRSLKIHRVSRSGVRNFSSDIEYPEKSVSQAVNTPYGLLISSYGLYRYNTRNERLEQLHFNPPVKYIHSASSLPNGRVMATMTYGLLLLDLNTHTSEVVLEGEFQYGTKNVLVCKDGSVLAATTEGVLWRLSADFQQREKILEGIVVNDIFQDADHKIWIATYGQGVWCIPSFNCRYTSLQGLLNPNIYYSKSTQSTLITSLNKRPISYANEKFVFTDNGLPATLRLEKNSETSITYVYEPKTQNELVVGMLTGLKRQRGNQIDTVLVRKSHSAFCKDSRGNYWAGMRTGLLRLNSDFKTREWIGTFENKIVRSIVEANDGQILVGTHDGLFHQVNQNWVRYGKNENLGNEYVNALLFDETLKLTWVATNEGIFKLFPNRSIELAYPSIRCNSLLLDKKGNLWGGTSQGLLFFDGDNYRILSKEDGIDGSLFGITYRPDTDKLFVLSNLGVTILNLARYREELRFTPPRLIVTEQTANGRPLAPKISLQSLPSNTTSISLRISAPYYRSTDSWKLFYRINGGNWSRANDNWELNFLNLPFGEVNIELQLLDEINKQKSEVFLAKYLIDTPLHRTREFFIISMIAFLLFSILLFVVLMQFYNKRRQRKFFAAQRQVELEQKVLRNMLNPHFLNNAVNSIQVFVTRNDQRKTLSYLAKFARLMRVNLELLEKSLISLEKEIQNIELYLEFEVLRFEGRLRYRIELESELNVSKLKVPSLVLQPFVENAIWHGILPKEQGGEVVIRVKKDTNGLLISVEDDGIGVEESRRRKQAAAEKASRGLNLIRDRFEILNQRQKGHSFNIQSRKSLDGHDGTLVRIELPMVY
jgi:ligand-binding sensor domain-containing protein/anti-sigma regulatory factor (Ser/Thr protein kinase)